MSIIMAHACSSDNLLNNDNQHFSYDDRSCTLSKLYRLTTLLLLFVFYTYFSLCIIYYWSILLLLLFILKSCCYDNKSSVSVKGGKFFDWLSDYQLLEKVSAVWSCRLLTLKAIGSIRRLFYVLYMKLRQGSHIAVQYRIQIPLQRLSAEADSRSASQEISSFLWIPETSLPYSQDPATGPCREPGKSSPHSSHHVSLRSILILSSNPRLGLQSGLF
jgi:hypothetical protein